MSKKCFVVKREKLFPKGHFEGFKHISEANFIDFILSESPIFLLRYGTDENQNKPAEEDSRYQQIIPYALFVHNGKVFIYERGGGIDEQRLASKYSIGIGGHVEPIDLGGNFLEESLIREFREEINYDGDVNVKLVGYINREKEEVDHVHFGLVYVIEGAHGNLSSNEDNCLQNVKMVNFEDLKNPLIYEKLEGWSKIIVDNLDKIF